MTEKDAKERFLKIVSEQDGWVTTIPYGKKHPYLLRLKALDISQSEAASALGVTQGGLSMMLNGFRVMPDHIKDRVEAICNFTERRLLKKNENSKWINKWSQ